MSRTYVKFHFSATIIPSNEMSSNKDLTLTTLNAFLLPWISTLKGIEPNSAVNQYDRAGRITRFLKESDVAVLQEVWGR